MEATSLAGRDAAEKRENAWPPNNADEEGNWLICVALRVRRDQAIPLVSRLLSFSSRRMAGHAGHVWFIGYFFVFVTSLSKSNKCSGLKAFFDHRQASENSTPTKKPISR